LTALARCPGAFPSSPHHFISHFCIIVSTFCTFRYHLHRSHESIPSVSLIFHHPRKQKFLGVYRYPHHLNIIRINPELTLLRRACDRDTQLPTTCLLKTKLLLSSAFLSKMAGNNNIAAAQGNNDRPRIRKSRALPHHITTIAHHST
jgi:hypothetical protein